MGQTSKNRLVDKNTNMDVLIKKVLHKIMELNHNNIPGDILGNVVVFVGDISFMEEVTSSIISSLPQNYNATIDIQHIDYSTKYLKGHKFCISIYHDSCFRYISPHEFLNTHYKWLEKQVRQLYGKQYEIGNFFSVEDAFQEVCLHYLDKILSKYTPETRCNLRSFVANRLRRYFQYIINKQLLIRQNEILVMLERSE